MRAGQWRGFGLAICASLHWSVFVPREDSGRAIQHVTLPKVRRWQKVQVETGLAHQCRRQRLIEMDRDADALPFGRELPPIAPGELRIARIGDQLVRDDAMLPRGETW